MRAYAREKRMPWTSGVWVSKQDHRVVAEHDLSPGVTQRASRSCQHRRHARQLERRRRDVWEAGAGQRRVGKVSARQGRARGVAQSGSRAVGAWHMAGKCSGDASAEKQRRPGLEEEDED
jgi:hypothetical protein